MSTTCGSRYPGVISIVVPVYNTPTNMLDRAMRSILTQSWPGLDVVVVDDGSDPRCAAACEKYANSDKRVRVIHQTNRGVSCARNRGIEASCGEFVMFVDPDDELLPDVLEEGVAIAEERNLDVVYATEIDVEDGVCSARKMGIDSSDELVVIEDSDWLNELREYFIAHESRDLQRAPRGLSVGPVARLIRWRAFGNTRFDERLTVLEDAVFNSELLAGARRVGLLDKPWYVYYKNQGSATQSMAFDAVAEKQAQVVDSYVRDAGLSNNACCSHMATYFMMTLNSLARQKDLSYAAVLLGYGMPCFKRAFDDLDPAAFQFASLSPKIQYALMHGGHPLGHYLFYRMLALAKVVRSATRAGDSTSS